MPEYCYVEKAQFLRTAALFCHSESCPECGLLSRPLSAVPRALCRAAPGPVWPVLPPATNQSEQAGFGLSGAPPKTEKSPILKATRTLNLVIGENVFLFPPQSQERIMPCIFLKEKTRSIR